jgi:hypothetical protein
MLLAGGLAQLLTEGEKELLLVSIQETRDHTHYPIKHSFDLKIINKK